jgi:hypothetical protein
VVDYYRWLWIKKIFEPCLSGTDCRRTRVSSRARGSSDPARRSYFTSKMMIQAQKLTLKRFRTVLPTYSVAIQKLEKKKDRFPVFTLNEKIRQIQARIGNPANKLPSLLTLAYVGYGSIDRATLKPKIMSAGGQSIQWLYLKSRCL